MSQYTKKTFPPSGLEDSRRERRTQAALVLRKRTFGMPAASVETLRKMVMHPSAVQGLGPRATAASVVDRNHDRVDSEFFPANPVVALGVVGRVALQAMDRNMPYRLRNGWHEVGRIIAGAVPHARGSEQMAGMVCDHGQLGITPVALRAAGAGQKVTADVVAFQSRRVDGGFGLGRDQAALRSNTENSFEESVKSPFLRRRSCAF